LNNIKFKGMNLSISRSSVLGLGCLVKFPISTLILQLSPLLIAIITLGGDCRYHPRHVSIAQIHIDIRQGFTNLYSFNLRRCSWVYTLRLFLPFPISLTATTTILPIITPLLVLLSTCAATRARKRPSRSWRRRLVDSTTFLRILDQILTIIPSVLVTLALTYLAPAYILTCRLENQWQQFFHNKNANAIRTIQDRLQCCGLRSTRDRSWPFPGHGSQEDCESRFRYTRSCLAGWRNAEQKTAIIVLIAAFLTWTLKVSAERIISFVPDMNPRSQIAG
jgi:hypothetical protein